MREATTIAAILLALMMAVSLCGCGQAETAAMGEAYRTGAEL